MSDSDDPTDKSHSGSSEEYEIGYCRPPVKTRFKEGNPGYPRSARKKKEKTISQTINHFMKKRFRVEENGKAKTVTGEELIIGALFRAAVRGDLRAARTLFGLRDQYRDSDDTTLNPSDLEKEDRKIIEEYIKDWQPEEPTDETRDEDDNSEQTSKDPSGKKP